MSVELVHLGSLYHDDVMDEADTRRGVETVNAKWGNLQAILAGDFLLSRASEIAASLGHRDRRAAGPHHRPALLRPDRRAAPDLQHQPDRGRVPGLDRAARRRRCSPPPPASAASSAARTAPQIEALTRYGHAFGMVFQIVDDVLDLTATEAQLGKPAGHDLVEGVYTLPVIRTLAAGGTAAAELRDLLGRPLGPAECDKALAIVRSSGAVAEAVVVGARVRRAGRGGLPGPAARNGDRRPAGGAERAAGVRARLSARLAVLRLPFAAVVFDCDGVLVDSFDAVERGLEPAGRASSTFRSTQLLPTIHGVRSERHARPLAPGGSAGCRGPALGGHRGRGGIVHNGPSPAHWVWSPPSTASAGAWPRPAPEPWRRRGWRPPASPSPPVLVDRRRRRPGQAPSRPVPGRRGRARRAGSLWSSCSRTPRAARASARAAGATVVAVATSHRPGSFPAVATVPDLRGVGIEPGVVTIPV